MSELLATCLAARYAVELSRLTAAPGTPRRDTRPTAEAEGNGGCDLEVLQTLCRDVLALRRLDPAAQRSRIEREAADREMRADEKQQAQERLEAAREAVRRENKYIDGLVWRLDHQNDPAYAHCCKPLSPSEEAYLNEGVEEEAAEEAAAATAAAEEQPVAAQEEQVGAQEREVGGSQSSPLREESPKAGAKGAGKTVAAVAPGVEAQGGAGQSNKGELSKIKADHEQPVGSSQSSPLREESPKADAKGAGKTGIAVTPVTTAQGGSGQSNKGELSKIKAN